MTRFILAGFLVSALLLPALPAADKAPKSAPPATQTGEADQILAAARAADLEYERHFALLGADLASPWLQVRLAAIRAFGPMQDPRAIPLLMPFLDANTQPAPALRVATKSLADLGAIVAVEAMRRLTSHADVDVRAAAVSGLTRLAAMGAGDHLRETKDTSDAIRGGGVENLGLLQHGEAADVLKRALAHDDRPHIRRLAALALGRLGDTAHGPALSEALTDADPGVRRYAAESLVKLDYKLAIPNLLMALEANIAGSYIDRAVDLLTGQDFGFDPHANLLDRTAAIEKGFVWWAKQEKSP